MRRTAFSALAGAAPRATLRSVHHGWRILAAVVFGSAHAAEFEPPSRDVARAAIGSLDDVSPEVRRLLTPDEDFRPIRAPQPGDWLASHHEGGQTFEAFRTGEIYRPGVTHGVIYLQPLGKFPADASPPLEALRRYAEVFFQLKVALLPAVDSAAAQFDPRKNPHTGRRQLLTRKIHGFLAARMPADAFCLLGITMEDLYPDPKWNFVFGEAVPSWRVGVYSFARYDPAFFGGTRPRDYRATMLGESCKVLVHETGHMFGIEHCIHYDCVMNGANNQRESQLSPHHACPVCLRKLHHSVGFDLVKRYRELGGFFKQHKWAAEEKWVAAQLAKVRG